LAELKKHGCIDVDLLLGASQKLPVRLVAQILPQDIAAKRRRKAKTNRDRRCKPSKASLTLLGWEIFITNVPRDIWSAKNVCEIYGLRWRIETIFKVWKSHFQITEVPKANALRVKAYIYSALIVVTLFHALIFKNMVGRSKNGSNGYVSLLKLSKFFKEQLWIMALSLQNKNSFKNYIRQMIYHSCYEKRRNRLCYHEVLSSLS
jgi:hypothetical protein